MTASLCSLIDSWAVALLLLLFSSLCCSDTFSMFSCDTAILPALSASRRLMSVCLLAGRISSLSESSTASEQRLRHSSPVLGSTSANLVRNKRFSSPCRSASVCGRRKMTACGVTTTAGLSLPVTDRFGITWVQMTHAVGWVILALCC